MAREGARGFRARPQGRVGGGGQCWRPGVSPRPTGLGRLRQKALDLQFGPRPPRAGAPPTRGRYSGEAAVVRVLAVEEGGVLQEHGSRLKDEGGEQLRVDVVPGAAEPPGAGRERGFCCADGGRREAEQGRT